MTNDFTDIYTLKDRLVAQPQHGGRIGILICVDEMMSKAAIRRVHTQYLCALSALRNESILYSETISGDVLVFCRSAGSDLEMVDNRLRNKYVLLFKAEPPLLMLGFGVQASSDMLEILLERYRPEMDGRNEVRIV